MKKTIFCLVAAMAVLACSKTEEKEVIVEPQKPVYTLYGKIEQETGTKVRIEQNENIFHHLWQENDNISVIPAVNGEKTEYKVSAGIGTSTGIFFGNEEVGSSFYAIYPHNNANAVTSANTFTVTYPASQKLTEGSYDPKANVYVATGAGNTLTFYNTTAYLRLALYSSTSATVSKIELTALSNTEDAINIAGKGTVQLNTTNQNPISITSMTGGNNTITLSVDGGVTLSSDVKYFYVAVPAVTYGDNFAGYQVKIYSEETIDEKKVETYQFRNLSTGSNAQPLSPNTVRLMSPLEYNPVSSGTTATLVTGSSFNEKIKTLAGDKLGSQSAFYNVADTKVTAIKFETRKNMTGIPKANAVDGKDYVNLSSSQTDIPIIATIKDGVVTISTSAESITTQSCSYLFMNFRNVTEITGLESLKINTGFMNYMFYNCRNLKNINLSTTQLTGNYVRQMQYLCSGCLALQNFSFPNVDFYINAATNMFYNCSNLEEITNMNKVRSYSSLTNVSRMFMGCLSLTAISFGSNFTCSNVADMSEMFSGCYKLTGQLGLSNFNTEAVTNASKMFYGCSSLTQITFGDNCTFAACSDFSQMFKDCTGLTFISKLSKLAPSVSTGEINCSEMFTNVSHYEGNNNNKKIAMTGFAPLVAVNANKMFQGCETITSVSFKSNTTVPFSNLGYMFYGCKALTDDGVDFSKFDTSNVTDMSYAFQDCSSLTTLDLSGWYTNKVTSFSYMFNKCSGLTTIDMSNSSTESLVNEDPLIGFVLNDYALTSLTLGPSFTASDLTNFDDWVWSNPTAKSRTADLKIYCSAAFCQNMIRNSENGDASRIIAAIKGTSPKKFVFYNLSETPKELKFYSDSGKQYAVDVANISSDSYVGDPDESN